MGGEEGFDAFWVAALTPYGGTWDIWLCPTHKRELLSEQMTGTAEEEDGANVELGRITSYLPTEFDSRPNRPYEWVQPWLLEKADNHGGGNQVLMPDGSVKTTHDFFTFDE